MSREPHPHKRIHAKRSPQRKASSGTSRQYNWRSKVVAGVLTFMLLAGGTLAHWQAEHDNDIPASAASAPVRNAPVVKAPVPASRVNDLPLEALAPQPPMVVAGYNAHSGMLPPGALPPGVSLPGLSPQVSGVPNAAVGMSSMGMPVGMMAQGGRTTAQGYGVYDGVRQQFTGKERDNETALDYFGARYYSSAQGRFTSVDPENAGADPANPQSWNGYAYALNNPLKYVDPDGRTVRICDKDGKCAEVSDETANRYLFNKAYQRAEGLVVKGGKVYQNGEQIGTYANLDIDGAPFSRAIPEAGRYPYGKATLAFGGLSVLGGVTGGVGLYALGPSSTVTTLGLGTTPALTGEAAVTALASQLQFTATTAARQAMASRRVPLQTLAQAILNGKRIPDPQGAAGAIKIVHEIYKNGKKYNLEIIYREADKKILHFLYK